MPSEPKKSTLRQFIENSRIRVIALLVVGLLLIAVGLVAWLYVPTTQTYSIKVTGGNVALNRHKIVAYLERHQSELNLNVSIQPTEGTPEAVRLVQSGELDMAVVNGLLKFPEAENVRQVATITIEAVHLLVKSEYADKVTADYSKLNGLSMDVGPDGFETAFMARSVLKFLRLKPARTVAKTEVRPGLSRLIAQAVAVQSLTTTTGPTATISRTLVAGEVLDFDASGLGVRLTELGIAGLFAHLDKLENAPAEKVAQLRTKLPDAVIHVSTLPSSLADRLIRVGKYKLVPLRFARAFAQITVDEEDRDRDHIDQIHTESTVIPAYTYGGNPPVPLADCPTLGAPLVLIANKDVPDEVISRLLPRIFEGPVQRLYKPPTLDSVAPTYPLHPASITYRDRDKPIVRADVVDLIQQISSVLAPIVGGLLALWGYYRWRQTLRFLEYFRQLQQLDLIAKGLLAPENIPPVGIERVRYLEGELETLQRKAIEDFCENYFYGDGVFDNFLALLFETRDFLRRAYPTSLPKGGEPAVGPEELSSSD
ncbi:MAG: hypothetical protein ACFCD0_24525 [Gemmataceae bacterium]